MVAFYNAADQELYKDYQFVPQEKYRTGFTAPTIEEEKVTESFGIPNTNAFTGSGAGVSGGNAFGYGNAINPADPSVITSGPYAGQSGYYGSANYTGGLPGNVQQSGPGRYFDYGQFNEDGESVFYKDYTLQPRKTVPKFLRAGAAFVPFGNFALNQIENKMNPTKGMTASEIDKNYTRNYGIAGLSDEQKRAYDNLAGQGMLFDGSGGLKTLTGKNFTGKGYLEGQLDIYNKKGYDKYTEDEEGEVYDASGKKLTGFLKKQYLEASVMYRTNKKNKENAERQKEKEAATLAKQGKIRLGSNLVQDTTYKSDPRDSQIGRQNYTGSGQAFEARKDTYTGGKTIDSPSTPGGKYGSPKKDGGRVGFKNGGLASIL